MQTRFMGSAAILRGRVTFKWWGGLCVKEGQITAYEGGVRFLSYLPTGVSDENNEKLFHI